MQTFQLPRLLSRQHQIERIAKFLAGLAAGEGWVVEVKRAKSSRSNAQNAYLNGVAYKILGDAIGYERDDVSEFLCGTYFGWKEKRVPRKPGCDGSEQVPLRTTTTDENGKRSVLGKIEFADYVAFVQRFAAQRGVFIPDPDPDYSLHEEQTEVAA